MTISLSAKAKKIYSQIDSESTRLGDLRKIAKEVKKDHDLALELWSTGECLPRQLAILIMDNKRLTRESVDTLVKDMDTHPADEPIVLMDWFLGNQMSKDKKTIALMNSWEQSPSPLQRRTFWYHQARLRWMGKTDHDNTEYLIDAIESNILKEVPEVQWAMNFTAGWIGVFDSKYRNRCISIGKKTALYKDDKVAKNCTPSYLPEFIRIETDKRKI